MSVNVSTIVVKWADVTLLSDSIALIAFAFWANLINESGRLLC